MCRLAYIQVSSHALTSDRHQVGFHLRFLLHVFLCVSEPGAVVQGAVPPKTRSHYRGGGPLDVGSAQALETFHINCLQTTYSHDLSDVFSPSPSPCPSLDVTSVDLIHSFDNLL